jgi:hypothetical protein
MIEWRISPTPVIDGAKVWEMHATHGLPLEVTLMELGRRDIMVSWHELLEAASRDGAGWDTLIPRLQFAVREAYPQALSEVINERLDDILRRLAS